MFKPFYAFVAYRYVRAKCQNHFISFISLASVVGIALGIAVLITVLSVMNGFNREIRVQMLSGTPHITVGKLRGPLLDWQALSQTLSEDPQIIGVAPFISGQAMLNAQGIGRAQGVAVRGIEPTQSHKVYPGLKTLKEGKLDDLVPGHYGVLVGATLARNLGLSIGDKISLIVPEASITPAGILPRMKRFTVVGVFSIGELYDDKQLFINLQDADRLFRMHGGVSGMQLSIQDELEAPAIASYLYEKWHKDYWVSDWTLDFGNFFKALKIQKTVMTVILLLIIAVAAFNLVSSLVMVVTDKRADIAILRTLGASRASIMRLFMLQGLMIGCIGTVLGIVGGLFLATHISGWADILQSFLNVELVSKEIYLIGFLPSEVHASDVLTIVGSALLMCFIATLYPAFRAASIKPAEALRYA